MEGQTRQQSIQLTTQQVPGQRVWRDVHENNQPINSRKSMNENLLNLTPKKIINNLKRIEQAIKHNELKSYKPRIIHRRAPLNDHLLCQETTLMLKFVGLENYQTDVKFGTTSHNVAGYITSANNNTEKAVHITISDTCINNWKNCIAVLAHEICHKLLAVNGLYEENVELNETLVDLATIYVGFGNLILDGYVSDSNKQIIGYLNFDNYKVAFHIVRIIYGKETLTSTGLADLDFLIDDALNYWVNANSEKELMRQCFIESEYEVAEFYRYLTLLEQIVTTCKNNIKREFAKYDNIFFKTLTLNDDHYTNKLTAFSLLYDLLARENFPKHKSTPFYEKTNDVLLTSIYDLLKQSQSYSDIDLKYDFECPCCGTKKENNGKVVNRNTLLRCPKCGTHYYHVGEEVNFSKRQRELKDKRDKENIIIEERVAKKVDEIRKKTDERIRNMSKDYSASIARTKNEADCKISEIRMNEQNRYKQKVKDKTPFYLRWIICKYL
jgi:hypothetical protein